MLKLKNSSLLKGFCTFALVITSGLTLVQADQDGHGGRGGMGPMDRPGFGDREIIEKSVTTTRVLEDSLRRMSMEKRQQVSVLLDIILDLSNPINLPPENPFARFEGRMTEVCTANSAPGVAANVQAKVVQGQVYTQIRLYCGLNNSTFADSGWVAGTSATFQQRANCGNMSNTVGSVTVSPAGINCSVNYAGYPGSASANWH